MKIMISKMCALSACQTSTTVEINTTDDQSATAGLPEGWHRWTHYCEHHEKIETLDFCNVFCMYGILGPYVLALLMRDSRHPQDPRPEPHPDNRKN